MTIIVWKDGYIAADRQVSSAMCSYAAPKIAQFSCGVLVCAGTISAISKMRYAVGRGELMDIPDTYGLLYSDGELYELSETTHRFRLDKGGLHTQGSVAACFAVQVLNKYNPELTAEELVRELCKHDGFSGVDVVKCE